MRTVVFIILFFIGFISCNMRKNTKQSEKIAMSEKPSTPIDEKRRMHELIDSALLNGNDKAYNEVASYYFIENMESDFFYYAFTMANKNNSAEASYHVYKIIAYSTPKDAKEALDMMDDKTRNFAMYYLLKSYEMGYKNAKYEIDEIFGKDKAIPQSSLYLQKFSGD